jgi:hypothetical protein
MENINKSKREIRFKKEFKYYLKHPQYNELKNLYIEGSFKNIKSVENLFLKLKIKRDKTPFISSVKVVEEIKQMTEGLLKKKEEQKFYKINRVVYKNVLIVDHFKIKDLEYDFPTHDYERFKIRRLIIYLFFSFYFV